MDKVKANLFFRTIIAAFLMALLAYFTNFVGIAKNTDAVIIGTLMMLVPGLLFINAMRDIIYGDINSGINRIVQVFLIAIAISLGTGTAWTFSSSIFENLASAEQITHHIGIEMLSSFIGCIGFTILFNIHGQGSILCAIGGPLTWLTYHLAFKLTNDTIAAYFWATIFSATYAETMARIRKYPAISYLVISAFPLIPGAGVYYTIKHALQGNITDFVTTGMETAAIAGIMAVGILLVSTAYRLISERLNRAK